MDKEENSTPEAPANTGQIMDVQPPQNILNVPVVEAAGDPPVNNSEEVSVAEAPIPETDPVAVTPEQAPAEPAPEGSTPEGGEQNTPTPFAIPKKAAPKKSSGPVAAILIAILVAISLVGITVYAYMKTQEDTKSTGNTPNQQETQQPQQVTPEDVDSTNAEIDSTINSIDDTKELSEDDLSDQTLGL